MTPEQIAEAQRLARERKPEAVRSQPRFPLGIRSCPPCCQKAYIRGDHFKRHGSFELRMARPRLGRRSLLPLTIVRRSSLPSELRFLEGDAMTSRKRRPQYDKLALKSWFVVLSLSMMAAASPWNADNSSCRKGLTQVYWLEDLGPFVSRFRDTYVFFQDPEKPSRVLHYMPAEDKAEWFDEFSAGTLDIPYRVLGAEAGATKDGYGRTYQYRELNIQSEDDNGTPSSKGTFWTYHRQ